MPQTGNQLRAEIKKAMKAVCDNAANDLRELVGPWVHEPEVKVTVEESGNAIIGKAVIVDDKAFYLDQGTKIRWALMSKDFRAKTQSRSLRSGSGAGEVVVAGRSRMQKLGIPPRPGIKPRFFSNTLRDKHRPKYVQAMNTVIADSIAKGKAVNG